jgi:protein TonB
MKYDFSQNELIAFGLIDSTVNAYSIQVNGKDTIKTLTDHQAMYIGGDFFLLDFIRTNVKYPLYAQNNKIGGTVYIGVTIDSTGKAIDHRVLREVGGGCDQEAMRTIRSISTNWIPAVSNGKYITSTITIPVSFRIVK